MTSMQTSPGQGGQPPNRAQLQELIGSMLDGHFHGDRGRVVEEHEPLQGFVPLLIRGRDSQCQGRKADGIVLFPYDIGGQQPENVPRRAGWSRYNGQHIDRRSPPRSLARQQPGTDDTAFAQSRGSPVTAMKQRGE
jgi:hypothetical protein